MGSVYALLEVGSNLIKFGRSRKTLKRGLRADAHSTAGLSGSMSLRLMTPIPQSVRHTSTTTYGLNGIRESSSRLRR